MPLHLLTQRSPFGLSDNVVWLLLASKDPLLAAVSAVLTTVELPKSVRLQRTIRRASMQPQLGP